MTKRLTPEEKAAKKAEKAQNKPPKASKPPKQPEQPARNKTKQVAPEQQNPGLDLLKAKLRRKFALLKDDQLNFTDKEALLTHVCRVIGYGRPQLDSILVDL
jgi:hypothetical protein